jgi:hypothetical protein
MYKDRESFIVLSRFDVRYDTLLGTVLLHIEEVHGKKCWRLRFLNDHFYGTDPVVYR